MSLNAHNVHGSTSAFSSAIYSPAATYTVNEMSFTI